MGGRVILWSSSKNRKSSLCFSSAGQARIRFEPLSSCCGVYPIGMTRLLPHSLSSSHGREGISFVSWNSTFQNNIDYTGYLSCKSSSSCFFGFPSIPEPVIKSSESGVILSGGDCSKEESHLEPFVSFPCHLEEYGVFTRLIDHRVKTDEIFGCGEFLHRISDLCDYGCYSDFTESWDGKEDVVGVMSVHKLFNFPFQLFDLSIKLENSFSSPFYLIFGNRKGLCPEVVENPFERAGGRDIFKIRVGREELEEILFDFLSDNSLVARDYDSEIFPEAVYISCSLVEEGSSKSCEGAELELVRRNGGRGLGWERYEISSYYFSVDFIGFREYEVSFSELLDAVRVYDSYIKSFRSSFDEEGVKGEMEVSGGFHTYYDGSSLSEEAGEGEGICSKEPETIRGIWIFSVMSHFSSLIIHEAGFKPCGTNIDIDKKGFTHRTSFLLNFKCLVDPLFSDGYYPPGLRAQGTSCNQISPSGSGEPSSSSCSWHIQDEGLPATLRFHFIPFINIRPKISCI